MNVSTVKKLLLSTAIASLLATPALAQTQVDGSFDNATESQAQTSALDNSAATQSSSNASGSVRATADESAVKNRAQSAGEQTYSASADAASRTTGRVSGANSTAQGQLANHERGDANVSASSASRNEAGAMTAIETGDGVQIDLTSVSRSTLTAATSLDSQATDATSGLVGATMGISGKASGALGSAARSSSETGSDLADDASSSVSADADLAADARAEAITALGSSEFFAESVTEVNAGLEETVSDLGAHVQDSVALDFDSGELYDSLAGELSGEIEGSGGAAGGFGL